MHSLVPQLQRPAETAPAAFPLPVVFERAEARRRVVYRAVATQHLDDQQLNDLGAEGWLLVQVLPLASDQREYLFLRVE